MFEGYAGVRCSGLQERRDADAVKVEEDVQPFVAIAFDLAGADEVVAAVGSGVDAGGQLAGGVAKMEAVWLTEDLMRTTARGAGDRPDQEMAVADPDALDPRILLAGGSVHI